MSVKTSTLDGGIGLVEAKGDLLGGDETDDLRKAVAGFIDREYKKLIIDLGGVTYINSSGIGALVTAHTTFTKKGGKIILCGMNKNITNVFVITKLTLVFEVAETRALAAKAMA